MADRDQPAPRRRWWLGAALFVSLAVNLLVAGVVIGAVWGRGAQPMQRTVQLDVGLGAYTLALAEADRAALRERWRREGADPRRLRAERQAEAQALAAALRAEPFDAGAVEALFEAQGARVAAHHAQARQLLAERLLTMEAADRRAYAERLERVAQRAPRRPMGGAARP